MGSSLSTIWLLLGLIATGPQAAGPLQPIPEPAQSVPVQHEPAPLMPAPAGTTERPCVALVLSGGGARGCAHIGVLRVLEEMRIPVDYIAGTSIGAVVGGLYAAGLSVDAIEKVFLNSEWNDLMNDKPNRRDLTFRRKQDESRYLLNFEMGLRRNPPYFPSGLVSGQKLIFHLRQLTQHIAQVEDFNELPVPFRAVATNLGTGEMVVLDHGDLVMAIRASMAIPGFFSPVKRNGLILADGGMVRNLPVDVGRAMGHADVVIAVDVSEPLKPQEELQSLFDISTQSMSLLTRLNVEVMLPLADIALEPELGDVTTFDFDQSAGLIALGEACALDKRQELSRYSVSEADYAAYLQNRLERRRPPEKLGEIAFVGLDRVDERYIRPQIDLQAGDNLDFPLLHEKLNHLFGNGDFERLDYRFEERADKTAKLVVDLTEKPWGPNYMHFGLNVNAGQDQATMFSALVNLTATQLNDLGAEWRTDLNVGDQAALVSEFYQPLDFGRGLFGAAVLDINRNLINVYEDRDKLVALTVDTATFGVDFGLEIDIYGEIRFGIRRGFVDIGFDTGNLDLFDSPTREVLAPLLDPRIQKGAATSRLVLDRLDSNSFPGKGSFIALEALLSRTDLGARDNYDRIELQASQFFSRGRHTGLVRLVAGGDLGGELPPYDWFELGGLASFSGYRLGELRGPYVGSLRFGYYYLLRGLTHSLGRGFYLGGLLDGGNVWDRSDQIGDKWRYGASLFLGADTFLGPIYMGWGQPDQGSGQLYFSIGLIR